MSVLPIAVIFFCFLLSICSISLPNKQEDLLKLVIEEEDDRGSAGSPARAVDSGKQELACSEGSSCVLLAKCRAIIMLLDKSCIETDKVKRLTCGYRGNNPMVCCPDSCPVDSSSANITEERCGTPKLHNWWVQDYRGLGAQPWVARVGFRHKYTHELIHLCGGSIITRKVVLTAAHCALAKSDTHKITSVRVGEFDRSTNPDCTSSFCAHPIRDVALSHIIVHPGYDSTTYRHNIALLILKEPLNYSLSILPICLFPANSNYDFVGANARLVGWGKLANQNDISTVQQQLILPVIPLARCALWYSASVPITGGELCVGGVVGKDACSGFGGTPLIMLHPGTRDRYYQIGIVSFGADTCGKGVPTVYTRVDRYVDWIWSNVPKSNG